MSKSETDTHSGEAMYLRCGPGDNDVVVTLRDEPDHGFVVGIVDEFMISLVDEYQAPFRYLENEFLHCILLDDGRDWIIRIDDIDHDRIRAYRAAHAIQVGTQVFIDRNPDDLDTGVLGVSQESLVGRIYTHD